MATAVTASLAMYDTGGRLRDKNNAAPMGPALPISPEKKPTIPPPMSIVFLPGLNFNILKYFNNKNTGYLDVAIGTFDREVQFYIAYLEYLMIFRRTGLKFCFPQIFDKCKEVYSHEGFDLALAKKLISENSAVVCNDFYLKDNERIFVV